MALAVRRTLAAWGIIKIGANPASAMIRAHIFIVRFFGRQDNPHLRVVVSSEKSLAEEFIMTAEPVAPFSIQYCGDVDPASVAVVLGATDLGGLNVAASLRFAAAEYRAILNPRDPKQLERMAAAIEDDSYDQLLDGSLAFATGPKRYDQPRPARTS
jgi:hypothetical protein